MVLRLIPSLISQGFTQLHFTPLETLAIIEGVQKHVGKTFSKEQIESGVLEEILIEEDYNLGRIVSFNVRMRSFTGLDLLRIRTLWQSRLFMIHLTFAWLFLES